MHAKFKNDQTNITKYRQENPNEVFDLVSDKCCGIKPPKSFTDKLSVPFFANRTFLPTSLGISNITRNLGTEFLRFLRCLCSTLKTIKTISAKIFRHQHRCSQSNHQVLMPSYVLIPHFKYDFETQRLR